MENIVKRIEGIMKNIGDKQPDNELIRHQNIYKCGHRLILKKGENVPEKCPNCGGILLKKADQ